MEDLLSVIKELTTNNNHTQALIEIANFYNMQEMTAILENFEKIHNLEGSLPRSLAQYRYSLQERILDIITRNYGSITAQLINQNL